MPNHEPKPCKHGSTERITGHEQEYVTRRTPLEKVRESCLQSDGNPRQDKKPSRKVSEPAQSPAAAVANDDPDEDRGQQERWNVHDDYREEFGGPLPPEQAGFRPDLVLVLVNRCADNEPERGECCDDENDANGISSRHFFLLRDGDARLP